MRKIHNLIQGSPEWHAYRAKHFNASDAPAMMGVSPYKTRDQLLNEWATGVTEEVDANTQRLFDAGHQFEAAARVIAEKIIGEDLFPATVSLDVEGLPFSASLDGWTMDESIIFEHKTLNKTLESVFDVDVSQDAMLPLMYRIQMEQQLMVSGAEKCLFMASKGTEETAKHLWYFSDEKLREEIIAGWHQFAIDRENYTVSEVVQKAIAEPVEYLPAVSIQAQGQISIVDNLAVFEQKLSVFLSDKLIVKPKTDSDFETLKEQIKAMKDAEEKLKTAGDLIVAQIETVDKAMRKKNSLYELVRQNRLMAEKLHAAENDRIKGVMLHNAKDDILKFKAEINSRFKGVRLPDIADNLVGVISGLKTHESRQSKLNDEVARCKIEINRIASIMDQNIFTLVSLTDKRFLFNDLQQLIAKEPEHFELIVKSRLQEHEVAEQARIQAEAKRIADEQLAKERAQETAPAPIQLGNETLNQQFNEIFADHKPTPKQKVHSQFQTGIMYGLDLALAIFMKHGADGFTKAVEDFIERDCFPEAPKPNETLKGAA